MRAEAENGALDVSVVVPLHNSGSYIANCVEALLRQTLAPSRYEILVVDNNSVDSSPDVVRKYPRVRLLSERKQGSYAARNLGVRESRRRIIAFTDADCAPEATWLEAILDAMSCPEVGVVQGARSFGGDSTALSLLAAYEIERAAYSFSDEGVGTHFGYTNNMAVRREVFDECGPFVEIARGADSIFVDRVIRARSSAAVRFSREACVEHLEILGFKQWLLKKVIYGRSLQVTRTQRHLYRGLNARERDIILQRTIERQKYSLFESALLHLIVYSGALAFAYGRVTGGLLKPRVFGRGAASS